MNLPNKLSICRIALIPALAALMYIPSDVCRWLAIAVYGIAAFTDFLDGHIARKQHIVTDFGKFIDPVADKLLNLSALLLLCRAGAMETWVVIVVLARELCVDGLRMIAVGKGQVIAAGKLGKIKTVSQIVLILWQMVFMKPVFTADGLMGTLITLWVAVITLWSGIDYFVKNGKCLMNAK